MLLFPGSPRTSRQAGLLPQPNLATMPGSQQCQWETDRVPRRRSELHHLDHRRRRRPRIRVPAPRRLRVTPPARAICAGGIQSMARVLLQTVPVLTPVAGAACVSIVASPHPNGGQGALPLGRAYSAHKLDTCQAHTLDTEIGPSVWRSASESVFAGLASELAEALGEIIAVPAGLFAPEFGCRGDGATFAAKWRTLAFFCAPFSTC